MAMDIHDFMDISSDVLDIDRPDTDIHTDMDISVEKSIGLRISIMDSSTLVGVVCLIAVWSTRGHPKIQ